MRVFLILSSIYLAMFSGIEIADATVRQTEEVIEQRDEFQKKLKELTPAGVFLAMDLSGVPESENVIDCRTPQCGDCHYGEC